MLFHVDATGGPLGKSKYKLREFHFHWGDNNQVGSEHTVHGKPFSAEVSSRSPTALQDKDKKIANCNFHYESYQLQLEIAKMFDQEAYCICDATTDYRLN
jgi:hypothetical protein